MRSPLPFLTTYLSTAKRSLFVSAVNLEKSEESSQIITSQTTAVQVSCPLEAERTLSMSTIERVEESSQKVTDEPSTVEEMPVDFDDNIFGSESSDDLDFERKQLAISTKKSYSDCLRIWKEFLLARNVKPENILQRQHPFPSSQVRIKFLEFWVEKPRKKPLSVSTVLAFHSKWQAAYQKATDTQALPGNLGTRIVNEYVRYQMPRKYGLNMGGKEKYEATEVDLDHLVQTLWRTDQCRFHSERTRAQLTFYLQMHAYCGARTGTFLNNDGSGRCLTYKDIRLHAFYRRDNTIGWMLEITQRYTKGNPNVDENTLRVTMRDRENLSHDPVFFFIALALADNAFRSISSLDQLWAIRPPGNIKQFEFQWNQTVMDTPVLRSSDNKDAWTDNALCGALNDLSQKAGYQKGCLTIYCFRRGFANKIDKKVTISERSQALGHRSNRRFDQSYISRLSGIDGQAYFLGENPDIEPIEYLRSATRRRDTDLPQSLPAQEASELEDSPEMKQLHSELASPLNPFERQKIYEKQTRLRKQALHRHQDQWRQEGYDQIVSLSKIHNERSRAQKDFDRLRRFMPERARLADMIDTPIPCHDDRRKNVLQDLIKLCSQSDQRVLYRPNELPVNGLCPVSNCGHPLSLSSLASRSSHIHECRRREILLTSHFSQYCYRCTQWFQTLEGWEDHCKWHLSNLDKRCEIYAYRYTLIVPGTCPFCVGRHDLAYTERFYQWTTSNNLWAHVNVHLKGVSWPIPCPHPLCNFLIADQKLFDHHMVDTHDKRLWKRKYDEPEGVEDNIRTKGLSKRKHDEPEGVEDNTMIMSHKKRSKKHAVNIASFQLNQSNTTVDQALRDATMALTLNQQHRQGSHTEDIGPKLIATSESREFESAQGGSGLLIVPTIEEGPEMKTHNLSTVHGRQTEEQPISYCGIEYYASEWAESHKRRGI